MAQLYAGPPVTGLNFVGREKEIKYITELLKLGQNIVLIAPQRTVFCGSENTVEQMIFQYFPGNLHRKYFKGWN